MASEPTRRRWEWKGEDDGFEFALIGRRPKDAPYLRVGKFEDESRTSTCVTSLSGQRLVWLLKALASSLGYKVLEATDEE